MTLLLVEGLGIAFGGVRAVDDVSFTIEPGRIHAIIGPNGAGKTTLFNMISGVYRSASGRVLLDGEPVTDLEPHQLARRGLSRTFQNLAVFGTMTALENVMIGRHRHERSSRLADLLGLPSAGRQNAVTRAKALELLAFTGLEAEATRMAGELPYGALKRLEIARALATEPRLLLLDEPAAGCNSAEKREMGACVKDIAARGITVVLVEHDMQLVMGICDHILVLDQGRVLMEGAPQEVARDPRVIAAYLGTGAVRAVRHA